MSMSRGNKKEEFAGVKQETTGRRRRRRKRRTKGRTFGTTMMMWHG